jgi:hypothetical protein
VSCGVVCVCVCVLWLWCARACMHTCMHITFQLWNQMTKFSQSLLLILQNCRFYQHNIITCIRITNIYSYYSLSVTYR